MPDAVQPADSAEVRQRCGVALVTGGTRGIGRAIAIRLGRDGYDVALCYRKALDEAEVVCAELQALGCRVLARICDVAELDGVQCFVRESQQALGPLDVVVNCAGIVRDGPLVMMEAEAWHDVIQTNLGGVFNVCRTATLGFMKRRSGCIVNVSSVAGQDGNATQTNYSASKAGIIGFSKALAREVGPYGVRVNVVAPGLISTDMTTGLNPAIIAALVERTALRRVGEGSEVADVVSFLVSDRARYVTGQTLRVDGGLSL
jgi:3-oxoacyl-[acyl-carrier protein] reductase